MGAAATQSITESQNHRGYRSLSSNHKPCSSCFREIRKMRFNKDIFNYIQHIFYNTTTTKTNTGLVSLFLQNTALIHGGTASTRPLKVCCVIWHWDVSSRSYFGLEPVWAGLRGSDSFTPAHPTVAWLDWDLGEFGGQVNTSNSLLCLSFVSSFLNLFFFLFFLGAWGWVHHSAGRGSSYKVIIPFSGAFRLFLGLLNFLQGVFPHHQSWKKKSHILNRHPI